MTPCVIDAHVHFSCIQRFSETAVSVSHVDYSRNGLLQDFTATGTEAGIAMGLSETAPGLFPDTNAQTPMGLDLDAWPDSLFCCPGINPYDVSRRGEIALKELTRTLDDRRCVGIKLYAGYYPVSVSDEVYAPVYRLAADHDLPVVLHGGVTFASQGLLRLAHPLAFEDAIVRHPELTFVIAHMGEPWGMDTAALMSKYPRVVADLSGLLVTDAATIRRKAGQIEEHIRLRQPLLFEERPDRWLFGSDWPLAPLSAYLDFVRGLVPEDWHPDVFRNNALSVFSRLKAALDPS
jgi:hypothetical protein